MSMPAQARNVRSGSIRIESTLRFRLVHFSQCLPSSAPLLRPTLDFVHHRLAESISPGSWIDSPFAARIAIASDHRMFSSMN